MGLKKKKKKIKSFTLINTFLGNTGLFLRVAFLNLCSSTIIFFLFLMAVANALVSSSPESSY